MSDFEKASPRPWRACSGSGRGKCSCGQIWSIPDDANIAVATHIGQFSKSDIDFDVTSELVPHDEEVTTANAALIVTAVNAYSPAREEAWEVMRNALANCSIVLAHLINDEIDRTDQIDEAHDQAMSALATIAAMEKRNDG